MIMVKNTDLAKITSQIMGKLIVEKTFPLKDAYWINRIMKKAETEVKLYHETVREIVEDHGGKTTEREDGMATVKYDSLDKQKEASDKILELGEVEVELSVDKLIAKDTWPNLTIAEVSVLDAFTDFSNNSV